MSYYLARTLAVAFDDAIARTIDALKQEGFGVLTDIDVSETLKKKIGVEFPNMVPCNVVVRDAGNGQTEVAAIDPVASMQAIDNPALKRAAEQVRAKLERAVAAL
jgi:uncharacterized protein (DUF302 family)